MSEARMNNFTVTDFEHAKIQVKQGWLQGYTEEAPNGTLKIFKGIPYAAPPVGDLRFRRPQDPGRWRGIRRATRYSAAAVQHVQEFWDEKANVHGVPQMLAPSQYEEDCLYLNVWSPAKTQEDRLPVFIWVHGGGMIAGSGVEVVCAGEGLAGRKDVIVVTLNYRLGLFGFFAHPELAEEGGGACGNYGLYDIRKACLWVKENIAAFGGDPNSAGRPVWKEYTEDFDVCILGNDTHMLPKEAQARYRYLFDRISAKGTDTRMVGSVIGLPKID